MSPSSISEIKVGLNFTGETIAVGRLAAREGQIYFEYDNVFLKRSLEISPLRLPLQTGVKTFDRFLFEGLPGVFNDSLPDDWGRLLFDRALRSQGISPDQVSPLDRLAHVGKTGMGALTYEPDNGTEEADIEINLDKLAGNARDVMDGESGDVLQELLALNGSSAGAQTDIPFGRCNISSVNRIGQNLCCFPYSHLAIWQITGKFRLGFKKATYFRLRSKTTGCKPLKSFLNNRGNGFISNEFFAAAFGLRIAITNRCLP